MRLPRGARVLELGCWPGGWLQVLAERVGPRGRVVGVDLDEVEPLGPPVELIRGDLTRPEVRERIAERLGGPARLVLCDAAPKLSGVADLDRARMEEIHEAALETCERVLEPAGGLILKAFPGPESQAVRRELKRRFGRVRELLPEGRRASSREFYWVAGPGSAPRGGA